MDHTKNAIAIFDKQAQVYQDKYMDSTQYHVSLDLFCNTITTPSASVLEVACGPGNVTRYLLDKRPDLQILGTDLSPNMLTLAGKNNPEAEFQTMDCRDIGKLGQRYDALMCSFAFPYLSREEALQFIRDAARILNKGGVLYLSTMEDDYSQSSFHTASSGDQVYIYFHEAAYLTEALKQNGFRIISQELQHFPGQEYTTDLIIIAQL